LELEEDLTNKDEKTMDYFLTLALTCTLLIYNQDQTRTASFSNEKIIKAYTRVTNCHEGSQRSNNVVKIVYFHGNDSELQPDLDVRLTRILDDVSKFYSEEFIKHGIELDGVPFEKNQSSSDLIAGNDSFSVSLGKLVPGDYRLQLTFLFPNGMAARYNKTINVDQAYLVKVKS
jgi:hypothetical protein